MVVSLFEAAQRAHGAARQYYKNHFEYSVVISERDPLYFEVHKWLLDVMPNEKHRSLEVGSSTRQNNYEVVAEDSTSDNYKAKPLVVRFDDTISRVIDISGHNVMVALKIPDESADSMMREPAPKKIAFTTKTHAAQKAVLSKLEEINNRRATTRKAVLKMVGQWGGWKTRSDLPPRTLDSVSLPVDQKDRIVKDLATFLDAEDNYNRLAIPWHRGYMFHGPPGTGKTSLVKALANEFNLDLWYVSLSDLKAESSLLSLLSEVGPRSILLLEDIDTMRITHDRDGSEQGTISMSSLLNTLDGVATPHGLITVMTTNRLEVLDAALTRAGRMDLVEKLDYPTLTTVGHMYKHFYGVTKRWPVGTNMHKLLEDTSTSQIAEIMKRNMTDAKGAAKEIDKMVKELNLGRTKPVK